jgi:2-polyprenyl-3-methyl-5-hydroxy-6-metoxy-1,4-benzoquinol methylase
VSKSQTLKKESELNAEELMQSLRRQIEEAAATVSLPQYYPLKPKGGELPPISTSDDLAFLNSEYSKLFSEPQFSSHRPRLGKLLVAFKRITLGQLWKRVVSACFEREKQFILRLVKHLNFASQATDSKFGQIFWQLIKKIDDEVQGVNERTDRVIAELDGTIRSIERNVYDKITKELTLPQSLIQQNRQLEGRLTVLEDVAKGLERTVNLLTRPAPGAELCDSTAPEVEYLLLENRYRGSEERISSSLQHYVEVFKNAPGVVLDVGCGRGELLTLMQEAGIDCKGIDLDRAMVSRCTEKSLPVEYANLFDYLANLPAGTLGGIVATQVIEHLNFNEIKRLFELSMRVLKSDGILALETINPQSITALSSNFFRDPTHVFPIHPETLRFSLEMSGFVGAEILYLSPCPESVLLKTMNYEPDLPGRWLEMIAKINENTNQLNHLLYGPQDFAVIARVP